MEHKRFTCIFILCYYAAIYQWEKKMLRREALALRSGPESLPAAQGSEQETPGGKKNNYYMTAGHNMGNLKIIVHEKEIKGAKKLGQMTQHHSEGADPTLFPPAQKPN
jgi:hypothetical protein